MIGALVLRPEPGNAATAARLTALGIDTCRQSLFAVAPVAWQPPPITGFDALLLTSANAVRHAGDGLRTLTDLPVIAVGEATAAAARAAGLGVALTGDRDAAALVATAGPRFARLLHLAGRDRGALPDVTAVTVYRSDPLPIDRAAVTGWQGRVALLHSARAARRFALLVDEAQVSRAAIGIAALSAAVAAAAGEGWAVIGVAPEPADEALLALAAALIDPRRPAVDKRRR